MITPRSVIIAATQRLHETTARRAEVKKFVGEKKIVQANSTQALERRVARLAEIQPITESIVNRPGGSELVTVLPREGVENLTPRGRVALERLIGEINDLLPGYFLPFGNQIRRTVGRISVVIGTEITGKATGFLVSPRLLMTNHHVFPDADAARESFVEFDVETGRDLRPLPFFSFRIDPSAFFLSDETLDYAIVAVATESDQHTPLSIFGFNHLNPKPGKILEGEAINIIQHAAGNPRQYCLQNNRLLAFKGDDWLHYESDTLPGSSGAPLYNNQWEVIGLHHGGQPRVDAAGRTLRRDGTPAGPDTEDQDIDWIANEGARLSAILASASKKSVSLSADQKTLFQELLATPVGTEPTSSLAATGALPSTQGGENKGNTVIASPGNRSVSAQIGNEISLTIPVTITIRIGDLVTAMPDRVITNVDASPISLNRISDTAANKPDTEFHVSSAINSFERFDPTHYLDKERYTSDQTIYYQEIDWTASSNQLYKSLHNLLKSTHRTPHRYSPASELYPLVDRHPNGDIISIYTGEKFAHPQEMIRNELTRQIEFERKIERLRSTAESLGMAALEELEAALEAQLVFNCEHVVPQSWFSKHEPMRGDLHHLFACESRCNSARGNTPYFDFIDFPDPNQEIVSPQCGKSSGDKFEPHHGKGAVARATLYFLVRYQGEGLKLSTSLPSERIATIVDWATDDTFLPTDDYERHRNQSIFEAQGNRNPFVDLMDLHPNVYTEIVRNLPFNIGLE